MKPGEIITSKDRESINANEHLLTLFVKVSNVGDRPIQVGSHMHFFEVNRALDFDREKARGFRLNVPAGTAARFEPGDSRRLNWLLLQENGKFMVSII